MTDSKYKHLDEDGMKDGQSTKLTNAISSSPQK